MYVHNAFSVCQINRHEAISDIMRKPESMDHEISLLRGRSGLAQATQNIFLSPSQLVFRSRLFESNGITGGKAAHMDSGANVESLLLRGGPELLAKKGRTCSWGTLRRSWYFRSRHSWRTFSKQAPRINSRNNF